MSTSALDLHSGGLYLNHSNHSVHSVGHKSGNDPDELELAERTAEPSVSSARDASSDQESRAGPGVDLSSPSTKFRERLQFFALCYAMFVLGWNDGSTGPLLPRIQSVYHVRG